MTRTTYRSSDGRETPFNLMNWRHLNNAIGKLQREGADPEMLGLLIAERDSRPQPEDGAAADVDAPGKPLNLPARPASMGQHARLTMPGAEPLDAGAPRTAAPDRRLEMGGNNPPADDEPSPLLLRLQKDHAALLAEIADHEIATAKLPKEPASDDDVAKVNAWVVKARELFRKAEAARVAEKAEYLKAEREVDGFFKGTKDAITNRAKAIEQRNTPYLEAKEARARAERERQAAALRQAEQEAREREAEAQRARDEADRKQREAEEKMRTAATEAEADQAERDAAAARRQRQIEEDAAAQAAADVAQVSKAVDKVETAIERGDDGKLSRTAAGGGSASLSRAWVHEITDLDAFKKTPIGDLLTWLPMDQVNAALARSAKAMTRPTLPGVTYRQESSARVRATRS